jgi:RecA-family ATPase
MRVGKTSLIYALALAVAWGKPFLGFPTTQGGVLVLAVEEHPHDVELRLRAWGLQATDPVHVHLGRLENTVAVRIAMRAYIRKHGIKLVIIDTLGGSGE